LSRAPALLNPKAAEHLARICGTFSSDHDGERVDAHWRSMARACHEHLVEFNEQERLFIANMTRLRGGPSEKQLAWLAALHERIGGAR
jgi:hypothetical protein